MNLGSADQAANLDAEALTSGVEFGRTDAMMAEGSRGAAVLVLGMHRSGTSSLAGAIVRLGGAAPLNLIPGDEANPKGYWESVILNDLNEDILAAGGSQWDDWRPFDPKGIDPARAFALKERALSGLMEEFPDARLAVIKDPRMCRLMSFWSPVFREAGWSVRPVLQLRSPLEVALSLNRRDKIPLGFGCLIWLRHVLDAEAATRGLGRAVVNWNDFLVSPRRTLERVGKQLNVAWPRWSDAALAEIGEFVSADLRRQRASDDDLQAHPAVSGLAREAYAAVRELVEDPTNQNAQRALDDIGARLEGAAAIFGQAMSELEEGNRRAQSTGMALRDEYTAQLAAAREEFGRQIAGASTELADARGEFERQLAETRSEFMRQVAEARSEFARRLVETRSKSRRIAGAANNRIERAEEIVAYLDRRYELASRRAPRTRLRDYLRARPKEPRELTAIRNSAFFDPDFYLSSNPDVRAAGADPATHYLVCGGREGRDPSPFFSTHEYLAKFPDVATSGLNALAHYELYGRHEMRRIPFRSRD